MILCECGEFIEGHVFKDYIKTSANPSTPTIGHEKCGYLFNFVDDDLPKRYSSKKELKIMAMKIADKHGMEHRMVERLLLEVDRLKSQGQLSDGEILALAVRAVRSSEEESRCPFH